MKRQVQTTLMILLALAIFACAPVTPAATAIKAVPQETPPKAYHPLTTRAGFAEIDYIIEAAANGDVQMLRSLIQFTNAECTWREGFGGPPKCIEGEAEGTPVEALPFLGAEGSFLRKDEIENWTGINASGLYAIYEASSGVYEEEYYPAGEKTILFAGRSDGQPIALRISDGRIVRVDYLFDFGMDSLEAILQREAANVILAPPAQ